MQLLEEGQRFKRYRILRHLGSSTAGMSYEAEDTFLQRKVTLKQIHPWGNLPDAARRQFFREMQDISTFTHPYLAAILDYGEVDGRLYIARRYVTPGSLLGSEGRYWFKPPLEVSDAISYARQLAAALYFIHCNGYLHGALSFSNILVLSGPDADKTLDFAPFLISDVGSTHFVRRFGQPQTAFLPITAAPEQFGKRVTEASDQYALAVILYFWLTGRPPFLGTPAEIEQLKLTETITTLTAVNLKVPLELEGAIRRALSVYPEDRYQSIQAFADALSASIIPIPQSSLIPFVPFISSEMEELPMQNSLSTLEFTEPEAPTAPMKQLLAPDQPAQPTPPVPLAPSEPLPQVVPDVPQPLHDPSPDPAPLPMPETPSQPDPAPQPDPDVVPLPVPGPDIAQPLPGPDIPQPLPEPKPIPPAEPIKDEILVLHQEEASEIQPDEVTSLQACILITSPYNKASQEIVLKKEKTTLGRAGSSDILLDQDTLTSRHHALIQRVANHYEILDMRSANGVVVNGKRIPLETGYPLKDGDYINIGEYGLIFRLKPSNGHLEQMLHDPLYQA